MENACKYSADKRADVIVVVKQRSIELAFVDKGIGIPAEDIHYIFQPFHRAKNAISFKGHGLGLSLVKRIIELHGGTIKVNSVLGEGTTSSIELPVS